MKCMERANCNINKEKVSNILSIFLESFHIFIYISKKNLKGEVETGTLCDETGKGV
jgi:hypothetical protein